MIEGFYDPTLVAEPTEVLWVLMLFLILYLVMFAPAIFKVKP